MLAFILVYVSANFSRYLPTKICAFMLLNHNEIYALYSRLFTPEITLQCATICLLPCYTIKDYSLNFMFEDLCSKQILY